MNFIVRKSEYRDEKLKKKETKPKIGEMYRLQIYITIDCFWKNKQNLNFCTKKKRYREGSFYSFSSEMVSM